MHKNWVANEGEIQAWLNRNYGRTPLRGRHPLGSPGRGMEGAHCIHDIAFEMAFCTEISFQNVFGAMHAKNSSNAAIY